MNYIEISERNAARAREIIAISGIKKVWEEAGAEVRIVGSLAMGLLAGHRDIDLHVYSTGITEEESFRVASRMATDPDVKEIRCINGLDTDEHCIAWHVLYQAAEREIWKFDIIHIEAGSRYDGFFEQMAERIRKRLTPGLRELILKLKFETPEDEQISGVEYYEAVLADGIRTLDELRVWLKERRAKPFYYWMPDNL